MDPKKNPIIRSTHSCGTAGAGQPAQSLDNNQMSAAVQQMHLDLVEIFVVRRFEKVSDLKKGKNCQLSRTL